MSHFVLLYFIISSRDFNDSDCIYFFKLMILYKAFKLSQYLANLSSCPRICGYFFKSSGQTCGYEARGLLSKVLKITTSGQQK